MGLTAKCPDVLASIHICTIPVHLNFDEPVFFFLIHDCRAGRCNWKVGGSNPGCSGQSILTPPKKAQKKSIYYYIISSACVLSLQLCAQNTTPSRRAGGLLAASFDMD